MAGDAIGTVQALTGAAMVRGADGKIRQLAEGDPVYEGDVLLTDQFGALTIELSDGTPLTVGADSQLTLDQATLDAARDAAVAEDEADTDEQYGDEGEAEVSIGTVSDTVGQVYVEAPDGTLRELSAGDQVFLGETLVTEDRSSIDIDFEGGRTASFSSNTRLLLDEDYARGMGIELSGQRGNVDSGVDSTGLLQEFDGLKQETLGDGKESSGTGAAEPNSEPTELANSTSTPASEGGPNASASEDRPTSSETSAAKTQDPETSTEAQAGNKTSDAQAGETGSTTEPNAKSTEFASTSKDALNTSASEDRPTSSETSAAKAQDPETSTEAQAGNKTSDAQAGETSSTAGEPELTTAAESKPPSSQAAAPGNFQANEQAETPDNNSSEQGANEPSPARASSPTPTSVALKDQGDEQARETSTFFAAQDNYETVPIAPTFDEPVQTDVQKEDAGVSSYNDAPEDIGITQNRIDENDPSVIGQLTGRDPEESALTYRLKSGAADNAEFEIGPDNTLSAPNGLDYESGADRTVIVEATDAAGNVTEQTLTILVNDVNEAPAAKPDSATTNEDTPVTIDAVQNDSDVDGDPLTITGVSAPAHGTVSINDDNTLTYTPGENYNGDDEFTYIVSDGEYSTTETVSVSVAPVNDAPVVQAEQLNFTGPQEDGVPQSFAYGATDVDGDALSYEILAQPKEGSVRDNGDGTFTFDPGADFQDLAAGETRDITFSYMVADGQGGMDTGLATITVTGTDDAPVISSDTGDVIEQTQPQAQGTLSATDADNPNLAFTAETVAGDYGDLVIDSDGNWTYTLNSNAEALSEGQQESETLTVSLNDGSTTTVQIGITGTDDAPVISTDSATVVEETQPQAKDTLTATDADNPNLAFTAETIAGAYGDLVVKSDGNWTYTLNSNADPLAEGQQETENLTVKLSDGSTTTVTIGVTGTDDAPVISTGAGAVVEETQPQAQGTLTATDTDNPNLAFTAETIAGDYGDLVINSDGNWIYTLNSNAEALSEGQQESETLTVTLNDGSTTTVQIGITGTDDAPVISTDSATVVEETQPQAQGTLTATDADNPNLAFTAETISGDYGDLVINSDGNWTYTLNSNAEALSEGQQESETLTVTLNDGSTTTVQIGITGTDDAPVIDTGAGTVVEDSQPQAQGTLTATDADNPNLAFTAETIAGSYGDLVVTSDGNWTYTLNSNADPLAEGQQETENLTVKLSDGSTTTVTIGITGTDDAPVISTGAGTVVEDSQPQAQGTLNASDADNPNLAFTAETISGDYGDLVINSDGNWTYALNSNAEALSEGQQESETLTVTLNDGSTTTVQIGITGTDDAPVISTDSATVVEETQPQAQGTLTATDADNPNLAFTAETIAGDYGDLVVTSDGNWTYALNSNAEALSEGQQESETLTVTLNDGSTTTVQIGITGTDDAPVISTDSATVVEETQPQAQGTLTATDADNPNLAFTAETIAGDYGDLVVTSDGNWTYALNSNAEALSEGQQESETLTVTLNDGSTTTVQIGITGTDDAPVISTDSATVVEETQPQAQGTLTATDADNPNLAFTAETISGDYGDLVINSDGNWTYTLNSNAEALSEGQQESETLTVSLNDGSTTTVQIGITGTDDAPVISTDSATVVEETQPQAQGTLTATDADNPNLAFTAETIAGAYGDLVVKSDGNWTYTLNSNAEALSEGQQESETLTVTLNDGSTTTVQIGITGTDDAPVIDTGAGTVVEDSQPQAQGTLTATDADNPNLAFTAETISGDYGDLVINSDGNWTYALNSNAEALSEGQQESETLTVTLNDGSTTTVQIGITGTDDAPVISTDSATVVEETQPQAQGTLSATDADNPNLAFTAETIAGAYGDLVVKSDGNWTYTLNSTAESLSEGQQESETLTVTLNDGSTTTVQIGITGTDDAPVISTGTGTVVEETQPQAQGTLTATDADNPNLAFTAETIAGSYGDLVVTSDGNWTYALNSNADPLAEGQQETENLTVKLSDGSTTTVTIGITGTDDAAVLSSAAVEVDETNQAISTGGTLTISDVDSADTFVAQTDTVGTYGRFSINESGAWTYTANEAFNELNVGQSNSDSFTVKSADGTETSVKVTINGTNDAAVLSSAAVEVDETNQAISTGGTLTISDVDSADTFVAQTDTVGTYGRFSINESGAWTYTANEAFNELNVGQSNSDSFTVKSADGTETSVKVTINGTNDAAVLSSAAVEVDETNQAISTGGTLTISDVDSADTFVAQTDTVGTYGRFSINESGAWTYTANEAFDELNVGQSNSDSFTVKSADGTETSVKVTINGTNDAAVLSSAAVEVDETNQAISTGGTLTISDVDSADTFVAQTDTVGTYGRFSINESGAWTYTANEAFNELNVGQSNSDSFTVKSADGTETSVKVTINGTNDAAVLSSAAVEVDETNQAISTGGTLTISDVDSADTFVAQTDTVGTYGRFSINESGAWTYTANEAFDELNVGQSYSDSFTVKSTDGTETSVKVTINGTNDGPVAVADTGITNENDTLTVDVLANDTDQDLSDTHTIDSANITSGNGTVSIVNNQVEWNPGSDYDYLAVGESANVSVDYVMSDNQGASSTATLSITVNGTNDGPVAVADTGTTNENDPLTVDVLANDTDQDLSDTHTVDSASITSGNGTVAIVDNQIEWNPGSDYDYLAVGESANVSVDYVMSDNQGASSTATLTISVNGTNDAPVISVGTADSDAATLTEGNAGLQASDTLSVEDLDTTDNVTTKVDSVSVLGPDNGLTNDQLKAMMAVDTGNVIDGTGTTGTITWDFDSGNEAFNHLANGESLVMTYTISASDDDGTPLSDTQDVTITVNGTNDAPVISVGTADSDAATLTEGNAGLQASDTLSVEDLDTTDNVTTKVDSVSVLGPDNGLTNDQLKAMMAVDTGNIIDGTGTTGTITWDFDSGNEAFNHLANGESLVMTYTISASDDDGTPLSDTQDVTITVNGTNDAPVISVGTADSDAATLTEGNAGLQASDTLSVEDLDTTDNVTTKVDSVSVLGPDNGLTNDQLKAMMAVDTGNVIDGTGTTGAITWDFDSGNEAFNHLANGESLVMTYTISASDDDGTPLSDTQDVTISVNGTNDAPVISVGTADSDAATLTEGNAGLQASDTLSVEDLDTTDNVTTKVDSVSVLGPDNGLTNDQLKAMMAVDTGNVIDGTGTTGTITWDFDSGNEAFNHLANGESLAMTYTISASDDDGTPLSDTQDVTITVNGTNDAPVISVGTADADAATLTEGNAGLQASDTLSVEDLDTTDNVTTKVDSVSVLGPDNGLTNDQLKAMMAVDTGNIIDGTGTTGTITWDFDSGNEAFNHLASGESLVMTYTISASDDDGTPLSDTQDVTITVNGTNDAPVISVGTADSDAATLTEGNAGLQASDTLSVEDLDTTDNVTTKVDSVSVLGPDNGLTNDQLKAMMAVDTGNIIDGTGTTGTITWDFDSGNEAFNHLASGESLVMTYTISASDDDGTPLSDTQDVTITVNGTNDGVEISDSSVTVHESGLAARGAEPEGSTSTSHSPAAIKQPGSFTVTAPDGGETITIRDKDGVEQVIVEGGDLKPTTVDTTYGTLTEITYVDGVVAYTYTLSDNATHTNSGADEFIDNIQVTLTDRDGSSATGNLAVTIIDDAPDARSDTDADTVTQDDANTLAEENITSGNVITGITKDPDSAVPENGIADTLGADGATVTSFAGAVDVAPATPPATTTGASAQEIAAAEANATTLSDALLTSATTAVAGGSLDSLATAASDSAAAIDASGDALALQGTEINPMTVELAERVLNSSSTLQCADPTTLVVDLTNTVESGTALTTEMSAAMNADPTDPDAMQAASADVTNASLNVISNGISTLSDEEARLVISDIPVLADELSTTIPTLDSTQLAQMGAEIDALSAAISERSEGESQLVTDPSQEALSSLLAVSNEIDAAQASLADATLPDSDPTATGTYGSLTWDEFGSYTYTLNANSGAYQALEGGQSATDTFVYTLTDGDGDTDTATLTINIEGVNDAPVAQDDEASFDTTLANGQQSDLTLDLNTIGTDDGAGGRQSTQGGQVSMNPDGTINYTPPADFAGVDTITYQVTDPATGTPTDAEITVFVADTSDTLIGTTNDSVVASKNSSLELDPLAIFQASNASAIEVITGNVITGLNDSRGAQFGQDSDPDDALTALSVVFVTAKGDPEAVYESGFSSDNSNASPSKPGPDNTVEGQYGTLTIFENGAYEYRLNETGIAKSQEPDLCEIFYDTFDYTIGDDSTPAGISNAATLTIAIKPNAFEVTVPAVEDVPRVLTTADLLADGVVKHLDLGGATATVTDVSVDPEFGTVTETSSDLLGDLGAGLTANELVWQYTPTENLRGDNIPLTVTVLLTDPLDGAPVLDPDTNQPAYKVFTALLDITPVNDAPIIGNASFVENPDEVDVVLLTQPEDSADPIIITKADLLATASDPDKAPLYGDGSGTVTPANLDTGINPELSVLDITTVTLLDPLAGLVTPNLELDGVTIRDWTYTPTPDFNGVVEFQYTVTDGLLSDVGTAQLTIDPVQDVATITGVQLGAVTEDVTPTATGTLIFNDPDAGEARPAQNSYSGDYGTLNINDEGVWTYTLDNRADALGALETAEDSLTVKSVDGATQTITITITGTNDGASISGTDTGAVTEDGVNSGTSTTSGTLSGTDPDSFGVPVTFVPITKPGSYGSLTIDANGAWEYTLNNALPAVDQLNSGDSVVDSIVVNAADGTGHTISVTIEGANDAASIGPALLSSDSGTVTEDAAVNTVEGKLTSTDVDNLDDRFDPDSPTVGTYGSLAIDVDGNWTYTLDNSRLATQQLGASQSETDAITVQSIDGTSHTITITVQGSNDAATIGVASNSDSGTVTEDADVNTVGDTLTSTDVDNPDNTFKAATSEGTFGTLTIDANGDWVYTLDNTRPVTQQLGASQIATDRVTVQSIDGTTHDIEITINGANDAVVIDPATQSGSIKESADRVTTADSDPSDATGTITFTDVDLTDVPTASTRDGATVTSDVTLTDAQKTALLDNLNLGSVVDNLDGTGSVDWTYDVPNSEIDFLGEGDVVILKYTVEVRDNKGSADTQDVTITITGTNDAPVISPDPMEAPVVDERTDNAAASTASGTLTATDVDLDESGFIASGPITTTFGEASMDVDGNWTYQLDNTNTVVNALNEASPSLSDTFTVSTIDGTTHDITVHITGSNDAPTANPADLTGLANAKTKDTNNEIQITSAELLALSGASDVDSTALSIVAVRAVGGSENLTETLEGSGIWTYYAGSFDGEKRFNFIVQDGDGGYTNEVATVQINPAPAIVQVVDGTVDVVAGLASGLLSGGGTSGEPGTTESTTPPPDPDESPDTNVVKIELETGTPEPHHVVRLHDSGSPDVTDIFEITGFDPVDIDTLGIQPDTINIHDLLVAEGWAEALPNSDTPDTLDEYIRISDVLASNETVIEIGSTDPTGKFTATEEIHLKGVSVGELSTTDKAGLTAEAAQQQIIQDMLTKGTLDVH